MLLSSCFWTFAHWDWTLAPPCGVKQGENARMRERLRKFLWIWFEKLDFLDVECFCLLVSFLVIFLLDWRGRWWKWFTNTRPPVKPLCLFCFSTLRLSVGHSLHQVALYHHRFSPPISLCRWAAVRPCCRPLVEETQGRWCYWSPTSELTNRTFFKQGFSWLWLCLRFLKAELHSVYFHASRGRCFLKRHDGKMTVYLEGLWGFCVLVFLSVVWALQLLLQDQMQFLDVEEPATVQLQNQNRTRPEGPRLPGCLPACFYLFKALCTDECVKTALVAALVSREIEAFIKYMYIYSINIYIYKKKSI